jgi:site-specific recombinase XerC
MPASARARISPSTTAAAERPLTFGAVFAMREAHRQRLHEAVIAALMREKRRCGLSEDALAVRLGKTPAQIDAFLASPEGWTFEAMIDILTAAGLQIDQVRVGAIR